jgi:hypothetical protein
MRRLVATLLCSMVIMLTSSAAQADPDPDRNKNAVIVTLTCEGGQEIQAATIRQNAALALQLVSGQGVLILVHITAIDLTTGEVLFEFSVPGFEHNDQQTTTCTFTLPQDPDVFEIVEVVFRPN